MTVTADTKTEPMTNILLKQILKMRLYKQNKPGFNAVKNTSVCIRKEKLLSGGAFAELI